MRIGVGSYYKLCIGPLKSSGEHNVKTKEMTAAFQLKDFF